MVEYRCVVLIGRRSPPYKVYVFTAVSPFICLLFSALSRCCNSAGFSLHSACVGVAIVGRFSGQAYFMLNPSFCPMGTRVQRVLDPLSERRSDFAKGTLPRRYRVCTLSSRSLTRGSGARARAAPADSPARLFQGRRSRRVCPASVRWNGGWFLTSRERTLIDCHCMVARIRRERWLKAQVSKSMVKAFQLNATARAQAWVSAGCQRTYWRRRDVWSVR